MSGLKLLGFDLELWRSLLSFTQDLGFRAGGLTIGILGQFRPRAGGVTLSEHVDVWSNYKPGFLGLQAHSKNVEL